MIYNIQWQEEAIKDLQKIDRQQQKKVIGRVKCRLLKDPIGLGAPLKGIFKGLYRYRYGSYRVIYAIDRESVVILFIDVHY